MVIFMSYELYLKKKKRDEIFWPLWRVSKQRDWVAGRAVGGVAVTIGQQPRGNWKVSLLEPQWAGWDGGNEGSGWLLMWVWACDGLDSKASACQPVQVVQSLGREDTLEEEMATHSSILAWRIPWTKEPGELRSMGLQRVGHDWVTNTFTFVNIGVHVSFQIIVLSEHMPKTDIARSYGSSYFEFFEEPSYCFPLWLHQIYIPNRLKNNLHNF